MLVGTEFLALLAESNLLDSIPCAIFLKDKDSKFIGCNTFLANLAGFPDGASMAGKTDDEMPWADQSLNYHEMDQAVISAGKTINKVETIRLAKGEIVARTVKGPLYIQGKLVGLIGAFVDITDLMKLKSAAEAANRAKTEFLANMSHDVKTPMTGIVGVADLMCAGADWRTEENARIIYHSGQQVLNFFNNCLELSKLEMAEFSLKEEPFSLRSVFEEIYALFLPKAKIKNLELIIDYDATLPQVLLGCRNSLYRVILNLVGNALKFTKKGSVTLSALKKYQASDEAITLEIRVRDTGIGIPEDKYPVIFEKLRRLTPSYEGKMEGSGIGLYIVDQYIKRMGGEIQVKSQLEKGSTFFVTIPLKMAAASL